MVKTAHARTRGSAVADYGVLRSLSIRCGSDDGEGHTHFGLYATFSRAERLLQAVARDCDPKLERVPWIVDVQG